MIPFPAIPADAVPFFVSDAHSLDVQPGNPWIHHPGVANQGGTIPPGFQVDLYLVAGEICVLPSPSAGLLLNVDVDLELYDIGRGDQIPTGRVAHFVSPYGNAQNGKWLNASASSDRSPVSRRLFPLEAPMKLTVVTPSTGGAFQIGARFLFFSGLTAPLRCHYTYLVLGAWKGIAL